MSPKNSTKKTILKALKARRKNEKNFLSHLGYVDAVRTHILGALAEHGVQVSKKEKKKIWGKVKRALAQSSVQTPPSDDMPTTSGVQSATAGVGLQQQASKNIEVSAAIQNIMERILPAAVKRVNTKRKKKKKLPFVKQQTLKEFKENSLRPENPTTLLEAKDNFNVTVNSDDDCICIDDEIERVTLLDDDDAEESPTALDAVPISPNTQRILDDIDRSINNNNDSAPIDENPRTSSLPAMSCAAESDFTKDIETSDLFFISANPCLELRFSKLESPDDGKSKASDCIKTAPITQPANESQDSVILLDDSNNDVTAAVKDDTNEMDDSVVFVSETASASIIPLRSVNVPKPLTVKANVETSRRPRAPCSDLFTRAERKQLTKYNENAYNPGTDENAVKKAKGKRMVIIDGSNVAYHHALAQIFSVEGLQICLEYFEKKGHEVKAIVPQFRLCRNKSSNHEKLEELYKQGKVILTPCKNLPNARTCSYDDRFILQLAYELDAAIVSNDNYRDLIHENAAFKKIIENRVIGYTWCNDVFILPKDPYGRWGPNLDTILNH